MKVYGNTLGKYRKVTHSASENLLTRVVRPVCALALTATACVMVLTGGSIPSEMWTVIQIVLGGYVIGRSAEKALRELSRSQ